MATLYKHKTEGGLYYIATKMPAMTMCTGYTHESENYYTGERQKFTSYGQWRERDMVPVSHD